MIYSFLEPNKVSPQKRWTTPCTTRTSDSACATSATMAISWADTTSHAASATIWSRCAQLFYSYKLDMMLMVMKLMKMFFKGGHKEVPALAACRDDPVIPEPEVPTYLDLC